MAYCCYRRDGRPDEVQERASRSRSSSVRSGPPGWPWRPARVVRDLPAGSENPLERRASTVWAGVLLVWVAGLALVATAIAQLRQG